MIYYIVFVILLICTFFSNFFKMKERSVIFWTLGFCIFLMAALRFKTGYDYDSYNEIFNIVKKSSHSIAKLSDQLNIEIGFIALIKIFRNLSFNGFIVVVSAIAVLPKLYAIHKVDKNIFLMLLCYYSSIFLTYDMGVVRQAVSLSILLFAIKPLIKREFVKFELIVLIASCFHTTSLIFSLVYLIKREKYNLKTYLAISAGCILVPFIFNSMIIVNILEKLNINILQTKVNYYTYYYEQDNIFVSIIKRIIIMWIMLYLCPRDINKQKKEICGLFWVSLNGYMLSIILMSLLSDVAIIATRGTVSLYSLQIIGFGFIAENNLNWKKMLITLLCGALFFVSLIGPIKDVNNFYTPYQTWIGKNT